MKPYLSLVCAALVVLGGLATTVQSQEKPPQRFAFVDVSKALDTYRKFRESIERLQTKGDDILAQLKSRASQIEQEETSRLNTLNPGTPEYAKLKREIAMARYVIDFDRDQSRKDLAAEERKIRTLVYKEISQEAANYAQEQGLTAVFSYVPVESELIARDPEPFIALRAVLWRDEQFDVTEAIVKRLNALLPPATAKAPAVPPVGPSDPPKDDKPK